MSAAFERRASEVLAENAGLRRQLEASVVEIQQVTATKESLARTVDELRAKIAELEKRLGKDSSNSSLPPSSDRFKAKDKPESPSRAARRALGRKPGKQPGAEGRHLAQVENPDEVFVLSPDRCGECGLDLSDEPIQATEVRQVLDAPVPRLVSIEYRAETKACRCGAKTKKAFPQQARGHVSYGPKIRAVALYLLSYQHLPFERCAFALRDLFGAEVSTGFLDHLYSEAADGLEAFMAAVLDLLIKSEVVHVDETFDHVGKDRAWIHVACNELYTLLHADMTRGISGTEATGLFPSFTGVAVHDRLAQYFSYDKATHAVCCAHLIRDLASVAMAPGQRPWTSSMTALLLKMKLAAEQAREAGREHLAEAVVADFLSRYDTVVTMAFSLNPTPVGRERDTLERDGFNLAVALRDRKDDVVRFVTDLRVPFTNNQAESDVRMVKIHSKVSGPFRALHGAARLATVRSYLSTAIKHHLAPFEVLTALFTGEAWIPKRT